MLDLRRLRLKHDEPRRAELLRQVRGGARGEEARDDAVVDGEDGLVVRGAVSHDGHVHREEGGCGPCGRPTRSLPGGREERLAGPAAWYNRDGRVEGGVKACLYKKKVNLSRTWAGGGPPVQAYEYGSPPHSNIASSVALLHCRFPSRTPFATQRSNDCDAAREAARNAMSTGAGNFGAGAGTGAGARTLNGPFLRSSHPRRQTRTE